jgi:hypothetical protein
MLFTNWLSLLTTNQSRRSKPCFKLAFLLHRQASSLWQRYRATTHLSPRSPSRIVTNVKSLLGGIELLEDRTVLSGSSPVFLNQFGDAIIGGQEINSAEPVQSYELAFTTDGSVTVETSGSTDVMLVYQDASSSFPRVDDDGAGFPNARISRSSVPLFSPIDVDVQGASSGVTGSFGLTIDGPSAPNVETISISVANDSGVSNSQNIGHAYDDDFFKFTATRSGQWQVTVNPESSIDSTFKIFDASGNPVTGILQSNSFLSTVNEQGAGVAETDFFQANSGDTYFVRVDGNGSSTGSFRVNIQGPDPDRFPDAPFPFFRTLYSNQNGDAAVSNFTVVGPGYPNVFEYYHDAGGSTSFLIPQHPGDTVLAYYDGDGPSDIENDVDSIAYDAAIVTNIPGQQRLWLAVQEDGQDGSATYSLNVNAPTESVSSISVNDGFGSVTNQQISSPYEYDFYRFTTDQSGDWTVRLVPLGVSFDATMNVFDSSGTPVGGGGNHLNPIHNKTGGGVETWEKTLAAGQTYYIRVDGFGTNVGQYTLVTQREQPPERNLFVRSPEDPVNEGSSANFEVYLDAASSQAVSVEYVTGSGGFSSRATEDVDYSVLEGVITFAPGETNKFISVPTFQDSIDEDDEAFGFTLRNESGATVFQRDGSVNIRDNDAAPSLRIYDTGVTEIASSNTTASFVVTLSEQSSRQITVHYQTSNGTASAGSDYDSASGDLVFRPGETVREIRVTVNNDTSTESDETFFVTLSSPSNATLADSQATATITDAINTADIRLLSVEFVEPVAPYNSTTPVIGEQVFVKVRYETIDLPADANYRLEFTMDGVPLEPVNVTSGAGMDGTFNWFYVRGGWYASPGSHSATVTLDTDNSVDEVDETNNTLTNPITFSPVSPTTLPEKFINPLGGEPFVDWSVTNYVDVDPRSDVLEDFQGDIYTYDRHSGHDLSIPNFAHMDVGLPIYAAADGTVISVSDGNFDRNTSLDIGLADDAKHRAMN